LRNNNDKEYTIPKKKTKKKASTSLDDFMEESDNV
jgi:hypothetical protein